MQYKKIEVGKEYLVETDGLQVGPVTARHGKAVPFDHGYTYRGVPRRKSNGKQVLATVEAINQPMPEKGSWEPRLTNGGVLVRFREPVKTGYHPDETTASTAVLSSRHIIEPAEDYLARTAESRRIREESERELREQATTFAVELGEVMRTLSERFDVAVVNNDWLRIKLDKDEAFVPLQTRRLPVSNEYVIVGWHHKPPTIDRALLFRLLNNTQ